MKLDTAGLPGEEIVAKGLEDLSAGLETLESLLVQIGAPRLRRLGFAIESAVRDPERALYDMLARDGADTAHGQYNALVRRLVSFERAAELRTGERSA